MYLVDTSAWMDFFKAATNPAIERLKALLRTGVDIEICTTIVPEILQGTADPQQLPNTVITSRRNRSTCVRLVVVSTCVDCNQQKVKEGLADLKADRTIPNEQVKAELGEMVIK